MWHLAVWHNWSVDAAPDSVDFFQFVITPMDFATATRLDIALAEVRGEVTFKRLPTRRPRRGELWHKDASSGRPALGTHDTAKGSYVGSADIAIGAGRMGTINPVQSLGRQWVGDKDANAARFAAQVKADRRAAAAERRGS